jgi:hypothetical protein
MHPSDRSTLVLVLAFAVAAGAGAQSTGPPQGAGPRPPSPLIQNASPIPPEVERAQHEYSECVRQKQGEMQRYHRAREVRDLVDNRGRYAADLRANPQLALKYPGGVDQVIDEAFRHYRAAGGTATTPQAVQPGEPPCASPVKAPPGSRAADAQQASPVTQSRSMSAPPGSVAVPQAKAKQ